MEDDNIYGTNLMEMVGSTVDAESGDLGRKITLEAIDETLSGKYKKSESESVKTDSYIVRAITGQVAAEKGRTDGIIKNGDVEADYFSGLPAELMTAEVPGTTIISALTKENARAHAAEGDLDDLETADRTSLVAAINSENARAKDVEGVLSDLETADKSSLVAAINDVQNQIGAPGPNPSGIRLDISQLKASDTAQNADITLLKSLIAGVDNETIERVDAGASGTYDEDTKYQVKAFGIGTEHLKNEAVDRYKLKDGAVDGAKLDTSLLSTIDSALQNVSVAADSLLGGDGTAATPLDLSADAISAIKNVIGDGVMLPPLTDDNDEALGDGEYKLVITGSDAKWEGIVLPPLPGGEGVEKHYNLTISASGEASWTEVV
jgi:hypothetical protein